MSDDSFDVDPEGAEVPVRPGGPVGGHPEHDDVLFEFPEHVVVDAQPVHAAGHVVLHEDIGGPGQFFENLYASGLGKVDGHAQFVPAGGVEDRRPVPRPLSRLPVRIAAREQGLVPEVGLRGTGADASGHGRECRQGLHAYHLGAQVSQE